MRSHLRAHHPNLGLQEVGSMLQSASDSVSNGIVQERCPFCFTCPAATPAQFISHVGKHMQEVAHAAIPISLITEDTGSIEESLTSENTESIKNTENTDDLEQVGGDPAESSKGVNPQSLTDPPLGDRSQSLFQVSHDVTNLVKNLNEVLENNKDAALNTTLVITQLYAIGAALSGLHTWQSTESKVVKAAPQLKVDVGLSIGSCQILVKVIGSKLSESGWKSGAGKEQKVNYRWLETSLKDIPSQLEGQARAMKLLMTIFQCRTLAEQTEQLAKTENREVIDLMKNVGEAEIVDAVSIISDDRPVCLDVDPILMESHIYRRAYQERGINASLAPSPVGLGKEWPTATASERHRIQNQDYISFDSMPAAAVAGGVLDGGEQLYDILTSMKSIVKSSKDAYKSKQDRLRFDETADKLSDRIRTLHHYFDKGNTKLQQEDDLEILAKLKTFVLKTDTELKSRRGFLSNARRMLWMQEQKHFKETVASMQYWTQVVDDLLRDARGLSILDLMDRPHDRVLSTADTPQHIEAVTDHTTRTKSYISSTVD